MSQVLFLCTGNYYRSRYAEILFNHLAVELVVPKRADSRGLMVDVYGHYNAGPIATQTVERLHHAGIVCPTMQRQPIQLVTEDLTRAELVIALKDDEHRPMVRNRFPDWEDRIIFWEVHDMFDGPVEQALDTIDAQVRALLQRLATA